jgi:hypothetical protein
MLPLYSRQKVYFPVTTEQGLGWTSYRRGLDEDKKKLKN